MLLQTATTITDGYFTGNYMGENALAAINLGLPILYFYLGVGLCVGVGGTVICGRLLGAEEKHKASEVFSQTLATAVAICILTSIAVFLLFSPICQFTGKRHTFQCRFPSGQISCFSGRIPCPL